MDTRSGASPRRLSLGARLFVVTLIGAPLLPWAVAAVAKLYLQSLGRPSLPWNYFVDPSKFVGELVFSTAFALPFILYAVASWWILVAPRLGIDDAERRILVLPGFAFGLVAFVWNSWVVFLQGNPLAFFLPYYASAIAMGFVLGGAIVVARRLGHGHAAPHS